MLLIKSKKMVKNAKDMGLETEPSTILSAIVKLLPAEAIAFFAVINGALNDITNINEYNIAIWIGLFVGLGYVFSTRFIALARDKKQLKDIASWVYILSQCGLTTTNFAVYYILQMDFLAGVGTPEFANFIGIIIGFIWLAVYGLISYYWTK